MVVAVNRISSVLGRGVEQLRIYGKHRTTVSESSLSCFRAVRKLGYCATELSKQLGVSQPSVSISAKAR